MRIDTQAIKAKCRQWAIDCHNNINTEGIYLFGSLIEDDGNQFTSDRSDVDFVINISRNLKVAHERVQWFQNLKSEREKLELALIPLIKRSDVSKPIVSIAVVTDIEISENINSQGDGKFFQQSIFLDLLSENATIHELCREKTEICNDDMKIVILLIQEFRKDYLKVSALSTETLKLEEWNLSTDILPKDIMRKGALVRYLSGNVAVNERNNLSEGLEFLYNHFYSLRDRDICYRELHRKVSLKRNPRKNVTQDSLNLSSEEYLLIVEIMYDLILDLIGQPFPISSIPEFIVNSRQRLDGTVDDLITSVHEASNNFKWNIQPEFKLTMEEAIMIPQEITQLESQRTNEARQKIVRLNDRYNRITQIYTPLINQGLEYIIKYQLLLFPRRSFPEIYDDLDSGFNQAQLSGDSVPRSEVVVWAMQSYTLRCFVEPRCSSGFLEAWKPRVPFDIEDKGEIVISFSLDHTDLSNFLQKTFDGDNLLALAADNQPVDKLPLNLIAKFFIPELILEVYHQEQQGRLNHNPDIDLVLKKHFENDYKVYLFNISHFMFGVN